MKKNMEIKVSVDEESYSYMTNHLIRFKSLIYSMDIDDDGKCVIPYDELTRLHEFTEYLVSVLLDGEVVKDD